MEAVARVVVARVAGTEEAVRAVVERAVADWAVAATAEAMTAAVGRAEAMNSRTVYTLVCWPEPRQSGTRQRYRCTPHRENCRFSPGPAPKVSARRRCPRRWTPVHE